jgi:hypothetical protein
MKKKQSRKLAVVVLTLVLFGAGVTEASAARPTFDGTYEPSRDNRRYPH